MSWGRRSAAKLLSKGGGYQTFVDPIGQTKTPAAAVAP